jgi:hypothetical protein
MEPGLEKWPSQAPEITPTPPQVLLACLLLSSPCMLVDLGQVLFSRDWTLLIVPISEDQYPLGNIRRQAQ